MYYKEIRVWVPNDEILNIKFLKHEKFFVYVFINKPYIITAKVLGTRNFIGFGADGKIYLLDRENNREVYASSALAVFARQLKLFRDLTGDEYERSKFSEKIRNLDGNAFLSKDYFWSEAAEKYGLF